MAAVDRTQSFIRAEWRPVMNAHAQWPNGNDNRVFWHCGKDQVWREGDLVAMGYLASTDLVMPEVYAFRLVGSGSHQLGIARGLPEHPEWPHPLED